MAAMAERLYCADFSKTGKQKYSQQESKVRKLLRIKISISLQKSNRFVVHKTLFIHDLQSEIEVADFDRLLAKIEHVPIEHQEMRTLLIKVLSHIIRRLLMSKKVNKYKGILETCHIDLLTFCSSKNPDNQILKM